MLMRKFFYEEPLVEVVNALPEMPVLAASDQTPGLEDYGNGNWNWGN